MNTYISNDDVEKLAVFKKISIVAGAFISILALSAIGVKATMWAADQRYVTKEKIVQLFLEQRVSTLGDYIFDLELKIQYAEASSSEKARLGKYIREREEVLKDKQIGTHAR